MKHKKKPEGSVSFDGGLTPVRAGSAPRRLRLSMISGTDPLNPAVRQVDLYRKEDFMPKTEVPLLHKDVEISRKCSECGNDWVDRRHITASTERWLKDRSEKIASDTDVPCPKCRRFPIASINRLFPNGVKTDILPMTRQACEQSIKEERLFYKIAAFGSPILIPIGLVVGDRRIAFLLILGGIVFTLWGIYQLIWGTDREKYDNALFQLEQMSEAEVLDCLYDTYWKREHFPEPRELDLLARLIYLRDKSGKSWTDL